MKLVDKDEFISVCREIYARKGADAHELHFSLNDVINNIDGLTCFDTDAVSKAVEKQIPKKPQTRLIRSTKYEQVIDGYCPSCNARQSVGGRSWHKVFNKFCIECGQRLDWSEEQ